MNLLKRFLPLLVGLSVLGCGAEFDPPSELKTLRVLAVKKSAPYAEPGQEVELSMLWHDGSRKQGEEPREIERGFLGGCVNPPGDLYYGCFAQYAEQLGRGDLPAFGEGDAFSVTLPDDIISGREGPFEPGQPRYGLYIAFFWVCAGRLDFTTEIAERDAESAAFPVRCLDEDDEPLGPDDFVLGYTSIYSFEDAVNTNPTLGSEFRLEGASIPADCAGEECLQAEDVEVDCEVEPERCVNACKDDGDLSCPELEIAPQADPATVEIDDVSSDLFGETVTEQMWVNYYVDRGSISPVRLLNDRVTGWNDEYRAELRAPKESGPLRVWAVSHDNRGGIDFARVTLRVR